MLTNVGVWGVGEQTAPNAQGGTAGASEVDTRCSGGGAVGAEEVTALLHRKQAKNNEEMKLSLPLLLALLATAVVANHVVPNETATELGGWNRASECPVVVVGGVKPDDTANVVRIGAFNVQIYGNTKSGKTE
eukprot:gene27144-biopygen6898